MSLRTEGTLNRYDYLREMHRLATFAEWSRNGNVCPLILARLGFRYTGQDDTVICCHCQTEIRGWSSGDDVRRKHNSCLQQFDWNSEIPSIVSDVREHIPTTCRSSSPSTTTTTTTVASSKRDVLDHTASNSPAVTSSTIVKSNSPFYEVCEETLRRASRKNFSDIYSNTAVSAAASVPADIIIDRTRPDLERLKVESARLATFYDWPERVASIVNPRDLAKTGLFYTGQTDRVQCAFCRGYLRNWVQGDVPADEHRRLFPDCPFVRNTDIGTFDVVDNKQMPNQVLICITNRSTKLLRFQRLCSFILPALENIDFCVVFCQYIITSSNEAAIAIPPTGPATDRQRTRPPKHPEFSQLQKRTLSFHGKRVPAGQSVNVLALAGFFHVGKSCNLHRLQL